MAAERSRQTIGHRKKWQRFEQLVAAIHRAEMQGATVKWNDVIDGRQFDVTARFQNGPYEFLTVVECRDYTTPVKAEKVEALVTKARGVKADKAVMVAANGFQSGALKVAEQHGIGLFTLAEGVSLPEDLLEPDPVEYISVQNILLHRPDGTHFAMPNEPMKARYFAENTLVRHPKGDVTISRLVDLYGWRTKGGPPTGERWPAEVGFEPVGMAHFPSMEPLEPIPIARVSWFEVGAIGRRINPNHPRAALDPTILGRAYELRDELNGTERHYRPADLDFIEGEKLQAGHFYKGGQRGYYWCRAIDQDDLVHLLMIESYQHARFLQIEFTAFGSTCTDYVEVTDAEVLERLQWRLQEYEKTTAERPQRK